MTGAATIARGPDIAELKGRLDTKAETFAAYVFPAGHRDGREWRVGSIHGEAGQSLGIELAGPNVGLWHDRAAGEGGDWIALYRAARKVDFVTAVAEISDWLGLDRQHDRQHHRPAPRPRPARPQATDDARNVDLAKRIFTEAEPDHPILRRYFDGRGGLKCDGIVSLRFHPRCPRGRDRLPAMVAEMTDFVTNEFRGVHRTYLQPDGSGKADVKPAKMVLGGSAGAVIRLTDDADLTTHIGIAEGIESALAVTAAMGTQAMWLPVWSAIDAGNLAGLPVLDAVQRLSIFSDADPSGTGQRAAEKLAARWHAAGREVFLVPPPAPPGAKRDWNE